MDRKKRHLFSIMGYTAYSDEKNLIGYQMSKQLFREDVHYSPSSRKMGAVSSAF
jgi:hypothetical protein